MLPHLPLREGITEDTALEYFSIFAESFNGYFQNKAAGNHDYHTLVEDHEDKLSGMLDILLYGIAAPENRTDTIPQKKKRLKEIINYAAFITTTLYHCWNRFSGWKAGFKNQTAVHTGRLITGMFLGPHALSLVNQELLDLNTGTRPPCMC